MGCEIYARGKQREIEEKTGEETDRDETSADEDNNENSDNVAQTVGHNIYILAYQVRKRQKQNINKIFSFVFKTLVFSLSSLDTIGN